MPRRIVDRHAARVLLLDDSGRVLLFRGWDPAEPDRKFWFTVGGGREDGESDRDAAVRELREETGIVLDSDRLSGPVFTEHTEFGFGDRWIRQDQVFFRVTITDTTIDTSGWEPLETQTMDRHRWWSRADLDTTTETYYPAELPRLLDDAQCNTA